VKATGAFFRLPMSRPTTATEWTVRLRSPEATDRDRADFENWLAADPRNRDALQRSENLWTLAANARVQHDMVSELIAEANGETDGSVAPTPSARRPTWRYAIAAAVAAITVVIGFQLSVFSGDSKIITKAGEQRTVMLEDGSTIQLNTDTRISYRVDAHARRVALTRGEAFFDVAKDPSRPFVVQAGHSEVRVIGTQFSVRQTGDRIEVVVKEGRVEVIPEASVQAAETAQRLELTPGDRVELENQMIKVATVDVNRAMAWRSGEIEFRGEPLEDVIAELNRYATTPMVIEDDSLKGLRVSGLFKVADQQSIRFMLHETLGVEFTPRNDKVALTAKR